MIWRNEYARERKDRVSSRHKNQNESWTGQVIHFDQHQHNTLYRFFFEREQRNDKGEDGIN
ncbi:hypothetical protein AMD01_13540 [Priestia koreensis]|uniref:Uncharacterized protein n=1 Tax=Priestia koreensis TaxID=284581 RepID=A0A0M0KZR4_9BACI|nr:hypothetical protein AMD01_13540 [Priestia koreensis]